MVLNITIFRITKKYYFFQGTITGLQHVFIYSFETVVNGYTNCIEVVAVWEKMSCWFHFWAAATQKIKTAFKIMIESMLFEVIDSKP